MSSISIRRSTRLISLAAFCILAGSTLFAATVGTVVPIGGHAADIALDEARGVVYVANYTANRIEVVSMQNRNVQTSISVPRQPASISLSPDGRFLLVGHLSNLPDAPFSGLTILDLNSNMRSTFTVGSDVLAVAFGNDGKALIATTTQFLRYDPLTNSSTVIATVAGLSAMLLPVDVGTFPRDIIGASLGVSRDGAWIYGTVNAHEHQPDEGEDVVMHFSYEVGRQAFSALFWQTKPPLGPRVVSVDPTGSEYMTGWSLHHRQGFVLAQYPDTTGQLSIGGHAMDPSGKLVYVQLAADSTASAAQPTLIVADSDNLTVRERLLVPENLAGRGLVSSNGEYLYAASDSGLMIIPVGRLSETHRVGANVEDVLFRGNFCNRGLMTQEIQITDPSGGQTDFALSTTMAGVTISPTSGTTPATVKITVDLGRFSSRSGTAEGLLQISSPSAVNVPVPVRILVNNHEPDQRGSFFNAPGKLVDLVTDPARSRFYVLRQDKNQVLVYDSQTFELIKTLRTGNTPWQMAITADRQYLIVGADNSQVAHLFRLDTLEFVRYIVFPFGQYPRSIAAANNAILAAVRIAGADENKHAIDRVYTDGVAVPLETLGIFKNEVNLNTMLTPSPSGSSIFVVQASGAVMLYDANQDTFVAARKDFDGLSGAYGAVSDKWFVADKYLLNGSLVRVQTLETASGGSSGIAAWGGLMMRTTAPASSMHGVIQRMDLENGGGFPNPTRVIEAPLLTDHANTLFTRTLAPLSDGSGLISLSTSGFTYLPSDYDAAVAIPRIDRVTSHGTGTTDVATGGLMAILGINLSPNRATSNGVPLPTELGGSCLTINGILVPMYMASPAIINAQVPFSVVGPATMILRTPQGISNTFRFEVKPTAPVVFNAPTPDDIVPSVVRVSNGLLATLTNPVHEDDWLIIYGSGLGAVTPQVESGMPGSADPLSSAIVQPVVTLGGVRLEVGYAGLVVWPDDPDSAVGVYQINVRVPGKGIPGGILPLTIKQGATSATVYVRVVD